MSENEIKYYIYKTTNLVNGKIYIGYHASDNIEKDTYLGSGHLLKRAIEKHGKKNFKREILFEFDSQEEATTKEREIVNEEFIEREDTYNLCLGGFGGGLPGELNPFWGKTHSDETKKLLSEKFTGRELTEEWKQNISKGVNESEKFQTAIHSKERAQKLSESLRNSEAHKAAMKSESRSKNISDALRSSEKFYKTMKSEEHSKKMSDILNNSETFQTMLRSEERCKKISEALTGRDCPWVQITNKNPEKIRKTAEKNTGSKRTDEQKKNISESLIGKQKGMDNAWFKGYYITPFGKFDSLKSASQATGNAPICIRDRCRMKNDNIVTTFSKSTDSKITDDMIGKTWKELGWGFEPAQSQSRRNKNV
jgi:hypothetical protein